MPSSPQHPAPTPSDLSGVVAEDLALYREKFRRRLPKSLDELQGPAQGVVELPLHMAWSGMTSYDMAKPRQHMGLYRTAPSCTRACTTTSPATSIRTRSSICGRCCAPSSVAPSAVWEDAFPQLASRPRAAA